MDYFFDQPYLTEREVDRLYAFIRRYEDNISVTPQFYAMQKRASAKMRKVNNRVKFLGQHMKMFPTDTYFASLMAKEELFRDKLRAIIADSELLPCTRCIGGLTTVHLDNLQYRAMYETLMNCESRSVPHPLSKLMSYDFKRRCLSCGEKDHSTLATEDRWFVERRCVGCKFLIQFRRKHDSIRVICCPMCDTITSRYERVHSIDDPVMLHVYDAFFTHSCTLVNQAILG